MLVSVPWKRVVVQGGNKFGRALVMSDFSTVYCRPETRQNITSGGVRTTLTLEHTHSIPTLKHRYPDVRADVPTISSDTTRRTEHVYNPV